MFTELGELTEEGNGKYKFERNSQTLTLEVRGKDVEIDEMVRIRHFLDSSARVIVGEVTNDMIVVLDHAGARIYRANVHDLQPVHVEPVDPHNHDHQVHNPLGDSGGQQGNHRKQFYENVVEKLLRADRILMVGDGHGASSEVDRFLTELEESNHKDLAQRVVMNESLDLHHMTEPELLAKARKFFAC